MLTINLKHPFFLAKYVRLCTATRIFHRLFTSKNIHNHLAIIQFFQYWVLFLGIRKREDLSQKDLSCLVN